MGMTYGVKMTPQTAELVRMADEVVMAWSKVAVPGTYLVRVSAIHGLNILVFTDYV